MGNAPALHDELLYTQLHLLSGRPESLQCVPGQNITHLRKSALGIETAIARDSGRSLRQLPFTLHPRKELVGKYQNAQKSWANEFRDIDQLDQRVHMVTGRCTEHLPSCSKLAKLGVSKTIHNFVSRIFVGVPRQLMTQTKIWR